jgi:hypothetical protein
MTNRHRLLELALKGLESEQTRIQDEMTAIRTELGNGVSSTAARRGARVQVFSASGARRAPNKGKRMTLAQKRKISAAMKRRWAERKAA